MELWWVVPPKILDLGVDSKTLLGDLCCAHGSSGSDADIYDQDTLDRYASIYILYPKNIIFSEVQEKF